MTVSDQSGTLVSTMESVCRKMEANDELEDDDRMGECEHDMGKGDKMSSSAAMMMFRSTMQGPFDDERRKCARSWKEDKVCDRECTLILLGPSDSLEGCSQHKPHASCTAGDDLPGFGNNCDIRKVMNQDGIRERITVA